MCSYDNMLVLRVVNKRTVCQAKTSSSILFKKSELCKFNGKFSKFHFLKNNFFECQFFL